MFFKKKQGVGAAWWLAVDRKQQVYARQLADYLGRKAARLSAERLRQYLVILLSALGALDIIMLVSYLLNPRRVGMSVSFGHSTPVVIQALPEPQHAPDFIAYIDSLKHISANHQLFDSLLGARPGLADTLHQLEDMLKNSQ